MEQTLLDHTVTNSVSTVTRVKIDHSSLHRSLPQLLQSVSNVYMRNYSASGVGSISFRGTTPQQSQVVWHGFQLNSSLHGQSDLSLFFIPLYSKVNIGSGANNLESGSGALGANVTLNSTLNYKHRGPAVILSTEAGSFGKWGVNGSVLLGNKYRHSLTSFQHRFIQNNYPYSWNGQEFRLANAAIQTQHFQQDFYWNNADNQEWKAHIWWFRSDREVPAVLGSNDTLNQQLDQGIRINLSYKMERSESHSWSVHTAFFNENISYNQNRSRLYSLKNRIQWKKNVSDNLSTNLHLNYSWQLGKAQYYEDDPVRHQASILSKWKYEGDKGLDLNFSLMEEWTSDFSFFWPLLSLHAKYELPLKADPSKQEKPTKQVLFHFKLNRNYRYPSFNDLYWEDAFAKGNPNLRTENSWNQELGSTFKIGTFRSGIGVYHQLIDDWIQWTPTNGLWSPKNLQKVRLSGLEVHLKHHYIKNNDLIIRNALNYTHSRARKVASLLALDNSLDKQLIYVPLHKFNYNLNLSYKKWDFLIDNTFTGLRHTTSDHSGEVLPAFFLCKVWVGRTFYLKKHQQKQQLILEAGVNNLFNSPYFELINRPMPGRNWEVKLTYLIERK